MALPLGADEGLDDWLSDQVITYKLIAEDQDGNVLAKKSSSEMDELVTRSHQVQDTAIQALTESFYENSEMDWDAVAEDMRYE